MTAQQVMDQSVGLISEVKQTLENPSAPNKQQRLAQAAKNVSQALNHMVNCLPGVIEYENAIKAIAQASLALQQDKVSEGERGEGFKVFVKFNFICLFPSLSLSLSLSLPFSSLQQVVSLIKPFSPTSVLQLLHSMSPVLRWSRQQEERRTSKPSRPGTSPNNSKTYSKQVSC